MLKVAIIFLVVSLIASLGSGFYYLMIDQGDKNKRRLFNSLGARLGIALCLAALIVYGVSTGQIGNRNTWDGGPVAEPSTEPQN